MKPARRSPQPAAGRSSTKAVIALVVMGAIVVLYGWNSVFLAPRGQARAAVQQELAAARTAEQDLRANLAQLRKLATDTQSREAELARLNRLIPSSADVAGAILALDGTAREAQVAWSTFTPAPPAEAVGGGPATLGLTIRVGGTFHQIRDYLGRLESLDRLVVVDSVSLTGGNSATPGSPALEADLRARMFAAKGPAAATAAPTPPAPATPAAGTPVAGSPVAHTPAAGPGATPGAAAVTKDGQ